MSEHVADLGVPVDTHHQVCISCGCFRGQKLDTGNGRSHIVIWIPDTPDGEGGWAFDFETSNLDNLIELLQQLKHTAAVPAQLHSVQNDSERNDNATEHKPACERERGDVNVSCAHDCPACAAESL